MYYLIRLNFTNSIWSFDLLIQKRFEISLINKSNLINLTFYMLQNILNFHQKNTSFHSNGFSRRFEKIREIKHGVHFVVNQSAILTVIFSSKIFKSKFENT